MMATTTRPLRRILGLGFGFAFVFGSMVGVGILRLPGTVAAALGDPVLVMVAWCAGGLYALMGAVTVAELAAMMPETGGFRVYARHAFGDGVGFAVGWTDWLCGVATIAYAAVTASAFLGALWPAVNAHPRLGAILVLGLFTVIQWTGLRFGSRLTSLISITIGVTLMVLVTACLLSPPAAAPAAQLAGTAAAHPLLSIGMIFAMVPALRAILTAYDGWYAPIYMAEENTDPARTLPRTIIGGALLVIGLYLLINYAFLRVLPLPVLAASELPAADAARRVLPLGGAEFVTVVSLLTVLSLINNVMLMTTRVLYAIGRDGLFAARAAHVSDGGTPRSAMVLTSVFALAVVLSGSFEQIVALSAVLFLAYYTSAFVAMFVLRFRLPHRHRPYRAHGYPLTSAIVLLGSLAFLAAAVAEDPRSGVIAIAFLCACVPCYGWAARTRRRRAGAVTA